MSQINSNGSQKNNPASGQAEIDPEDNAVDASEGTSSSLSSASHHDLDFVLANAPVDLPFSKISRDNNEPLSQSLPDFRGGYHLSDHVSPRVESSKAVDPGQIHKELAKHNMIFPTSWLSGSKSKKRHVSINIPPYSIEYSVFRPVAHTRRIRNSSDVQRHLVDVLERDGFILEDGEWPENYMDTENFNSMVNSIVHDVENDSDLKPMRISQGSSGSYFILGKTFDHDVDESDYTYKITKRGIFKPKDEEPYGPLSPKWSKWLHRTFFPCFFGRSCLIPNLGYISEAAACVLDRQLMLFIVPYTDIIHLKSSQFYYTFWERTRKKTAYKIGSFQCFLNDYVGANVFLKQYPFPQNLDNVPDDTFQLCHENDTQLPNFFWSKNLICQFQDELEKLVILDYIMRNTDRGSDNWMIKVEWVESGYDGISKRMNARIRIGAIDSGLAFPWKHPDEWRSFPFGWLFLPYHIIGQPFSTKTRKHLLPLLTSKYWWEQTVIKLKAVFQKDADFKERMWHKQLAVLKGQVFNVVEVLKSPHAGPLELIRRENLMIWDDTMNVPAVVDNGTLSKAIESSIYDETLPESGSVHSSPPNHTETTPLLEPSEPKIKNGLLNGATSAGSNRNRQMSGFDYNMKFEDPHGIYNEEDETDTRMVIIERLEKVSTKRPCFTWC